jgi:FkbM family methyltransferase
MCNLVALSTYYRLFGFRGVVRAARARLLREQTEITVSTSGVRHPVHLRLRTSDVGVFRQVLVTREYEAEFRKRPRVIVDAGANIGLTAVFYANKYPEATIVAIEPEVSNFQILRKNTEPYRNITALQAALWKANGYITLIDPGRGHYGFCTIDRTDTLDCATTHETIAAVTVDRLMEDLNLRFIDVLKIDIEASEKEVFETPAAWIDRVGVIVIELHDNLRSGCARSVYSATKNFEVEWRNGETVFLAKTEYADVDLSRSADRMYAHKFANEPSRRRFETRII